MNVTDPVGALEPAGGVTVAVKVMLVPKFADVDDADSVVVVASRAAETCVAVSAAFFVASTLPTLSVAML
jgi:hypothetical protein